jgi:hypothetical protein
MIARRIHLFIGPPTPITKTRMSKRPNPTCGDCYFQRAGLCALASDTICPTFRAQAPRLAPPPQPRLVPRGLEQVATAHAAA